MNDCGSAELSCLLESVSSDVEPLWEYRDDPIGFCRDVLGVRVWYYQRIILLSVRDHKSTAVASCHGAGKTFTMACLALWWFCTRKPCKVVTTAPTGRQVKNLLWAEIRKLHARAKRKLPGRVLTQEIKTDNAADSDWHAHGFASKDANAAQGEHSPWMLILYDEASGVSDDIRNSMEGALGDDNARECAVGNPTGESGFFREAFFRAREFWNCINISALRTPNVRARRTLIPGLVGWLWVEKIRKRFGEGSPMWICRVLGQFFTFLDERIVPRQWVLAAQERWAQLQDETPRILCADVASSGEDNTALVLRCGRRLHLVDVYQEPDTMANARRILASAVSPTCQCCGITFPPAERVHIDATGVGKGPSDRLRELETGDIEIVPVVWGRAAEERPLFVRLLDEIWWKTREAFDPGTAKEPNPKAVAIPPQAEELAEQLSLRRWKIDAKGKIKVETKNELRKRGAGSPDVGDAASLAFYARPELWII